jgi:DNA-binding transcriptional LysR family regulator
MLNWDDFRFVLAVTRMCSALGAARTLGVNQTTVVRRIAHTEEVLGGVLFERKQSAGPSRGPQAFVARPRFC